MKRGPNSSSTALPQQKRARSQNKLNQEWPTDEFDQNTIIDLEKDICALCKQGHEFGIILRRFMDNVEENEELKERYGQSYIDYEGVWVSRYSLARPQGKRTFVHYFCAFASPLVWFTGEEWRGVGKEVQRGCRFPCTFCHSRGATIGCYVNSCRVISHLPCAIKNGFKNTRYSNNNYFCPAHRREKLNNDMQTDGKLEDDIVQGRENVPIKFSNTVDQRMPFTDYTYITNNIDSDDVILNSRSVDDLPSCSCTGLCDNFTCECLPDGRNYGYSGELLKRNSSDKIVECNLKCSCSYRRCTNRIIGKGLAHELEIYRLVQVQPTDAVVSSAVEPRWAVRTRVKIPAFSFICEVNGQVVIYDPNKDLEQRHILGTLQDSGLVGSTENQETAASPVYCLDCSKYGNISHFIRKASDGEAPMMEKRFVYTNSRKEAIPRIGLFSTRVIHAGEELYW